MKLNSASKVRASISFPADIYEALEKLAKEKRVSLAWVVRDAAERYITEKSAAVHERKRSKPKPVIQAL